MLLIDTTVQPSGIQGLGCFANEPIARGRRIWVFERKIDLIIRESEVFTLPKPIQRSLFNSCYVAMVRRRRCLIVCGDNARFMNHSDNPNTVDNVACRDIEIGEEVTCDYTSYDLDTSAKLSGKYATATTSALQPSEPAPGSQQSLASVRSGISRAEGTLGIS
ncbi:MAG: SET domain-containing protein [Planctomycetaceae bacterium]